MAERLAEACRHPSHVFWPEPIGLLQEGLIDWQRRLGPRQITEAYLLALAATHGGRFVTFDQRIEWIWCPARLPPTSASSGPAERCSSVHQPGPGAIVGAFPFSLNARRRPARD